MLASVALAIKLASFTAGLSSLFHAKNSHGMNTSHYTEAQRIMYCISDR